MDVIACGGVSSEEDLLVIRQFADFLEQIGTVERGSEEYNRIVKEYYESVRD